MAIMVTYYCIIISVVIFVLFYAMDAGVQRSISPRTFASRMARRAQQRHMMLRDNVTRKLGQEAKPTAAQKSTGQTWRRWPLLARQSFLIFYFKLGCFYGNGRQLPWANVLHQPDGLLFCLITSLREGISPMDHWSAAASTLLSWAATPLMR